jgi:hypothetical protein
MFGRMKGNMALMTTLAIASLTIGTAAGAQRSKARRVAPEPARREAVDDRTLGFMFGIHSIAAPGVNISGEDIDGTFSTGFGAGAGVMLGYGFNERFSGFVSLDVAKQRTGEDVHPEGTFGLGHIELGVRANVPMANMENTLPYVSASVGRFAVGAHIEEEDTDEDYDTSLSGAMVALGAGFQHFFSPSMALDAGVAMSFGKFGTWTEDGDTEDLDVNRSTALRFRVGLTCRPR